MGASSWWASELLRLAPAITAFLSRRLPSQVSADEVAAAVTSEVVERLQHPEGVPNAWYGGVEPSTGARGAFAAFVFRLAMRRLQDELRSIYRASALAAAWPDTEPVSLSAEARLDARRALGALQARLDGLSREDREILLQEDNADLDGISADIRAKELTRRRVRRHRLREMLAQQLAEDLRR